jgi:uncharacterized protein (DUF1697 family)
MEDLKKTINSLGFENVRTYIQSGNVIFDSKIENKQDLENQIEKKILDKFEIEVPTFVRDISELITVVNYNPFSYDEENKDQTMYVSFARQIPGSDIINQLENEESPIDEFRIMTNHIFWLYHRNRGKSKYTNTKIEKIIKQQATRRNIRTVKKIYEKYGTS